VFNVVTQAEKNIMKDNKKNDAKTLYFIQRAMGDSIFPRIAVATKSSMKDFAKCIRRQQ
jgi:hypothetical protein